jgi:hypothetical protein
MSCSMPKIILILVGLLAACAHRHRPLGDLITCGTGDEQVVWRVALAAVAGPTLGNGIVLETPTTLGLLKADRQEIAAPFRAKKIDVPDELVAQFLAANRSPADLAASCRSDHRVRLVSAAELKGVFRGHDVEAKWAAFAARYDAPDGILTISRVALRGDVALVNVELSCGSECGHGRLLLLRRDRGTWVVQANVLTWLS